MGEEIFIAARQGAFEPRRQAARRGLGGGSFPAVKKREREHRSAPFAEATGDRETTTSWKSRSAWRPARPAARGPARDATARAARVPRRSWCRPPLRPCARRERETNQDL